MIDLAVIITIIVMKIIKAENSIKESKCINEYDNNLMLMSGAW